MRSLKEIALELLDKYEDSEMGCISEGISTIDDMNELEEECKWYREEIEAADVLKIKKGKWIYLFDKNGKSEWGCLRCSHIVYTDDRTERPEDRGIYYCPHCCSDNREENDNEMV